MVINFSKNLIYLLFELVIFLILAIQLYLLASQYVLPILRKKIADLYKLWKDLQEKLQLSLNTKKRLQTKIKEQTKSLGTLETKIQQWHTALLEKKDFYEKKQVELADALSHKKKQQISRQMILRAKQSIMPQAIAIAKAKLEKEYAGQQGKQLITKVLSKLGKK